jgi:hypothetical protein
MTQKGTSVGFLAILLMLAGCGSSDNEPPRVIGTFPENGATDVDPSITEVSVTFNEEMMDGNWSWAYDDKSKFPQMIAQAYYTEGKTKNVLPVKLEPNKEYVIWINSASFKNFKDKGGNSAVPFKFTFKTK